MQHELFVKMALITGCIQLLITILSLVKTVFEIREAARSARKKREGFNRRKRSKPTGRK